MDRIAEHTRGEVRLVRYQIWCWWGTFKGQKSRLNPEEADPNFRQQDTKSSKGHVEHILKVSYQKRLQDSSTNLGSLVYLLGSVECRQDRACITLDLLHLSLVELVQLSVTQSAQIVTVFDLYSIATRNHETVV